MHCNCLCDLVVTPLKVKIGILGFLLQPELFNLKGTALQLFAFILPFIHSNIVLCQLDFKDAIFFCVAPFFIIAAIVY